MRIKLFLLVLCFLLPTFALSKNNNKTLDELMVISGLKAQLSGLDAQIQQSLAGQKKPKHLTDNQHAEMQASIKKHFSASNITALTRNYLIKKMDKKLISSLLKSYKDAFIRKVSKLEEYVSTPAGQKGMLAYAQGLQQTPADTKRVQLVVLLDQAVKATTSTVSLYTGISRGILVGTNSSLPKKQQIPLAKIDLQIEQMKEVLRERVKNSILVSFLYSYKDLSLEELQKYVTFCQSKNVQKYYTAGFAGMSYGFHEKSKDIGNDVAKLNDKWEKSKKPTRAVAGSKK